MKNNNILYVVIIILVALLCLMGGILLGKSDLFSKENNNKEVILNYSIEDTKIKVNGNYVDVTGTSIEVIGKLSDVLVLKVWSIDFYSYYVVNKDANIVSSFTGKDSYTANNYEEVELKGNFPGDCAIENNSLIIKSDIVASEPTYNSCNKNDNDIVEYTEKFTYLGNGNFSASTVIKTTTAKEYIQNNDIKCD